MPLARAPARALAERPPGEADQRRCSRRDRRAWSSSPGASPRGSARRSPRTPARGSRPAAPRSPRRPSGSAASTPLQRLVRAGRVGSGVIRGGDRPHVRDVDAGAECGRERRHGRVRPRAADPRLDAVEQLLGDPAPPRVRLAVREPRHRRAQPRHRAERTGRTREGTGSSSEAMPWTVRRGRFGRRPKRRGPTLSGMSELADIAALLADRTRARILEELLGRAAAARGRAGGAGGRRAVDGLRASGQARVRGPDRRALRRPPPRSVTRTTRGRRGARGARAPRGRLAPDRPARRQRHRRPCARRARVTTTSRGGRGSRWPTRLWRAARCRCTTARSRWATRRGWSRTSGSTSPRCRAGGRSCARVWTGPSGGRTWRVRSGRRCLTCCSERGWVRRRPDGRALNVTRGVRWASACNGERIASRPSSHGQPSCLSAAWWRDLTAATRSAYGLIKVAPPGVPSEGGPPGTGRGTAV